MLRDSLGAAVVLCAVSFTASCGVAVLIPAAIAAAIVAGVEEMRSNEQWGTGEIRKELDAVADKLAKFKKADGSYEIPADEGDAINAEIDRLKGKADSLDKKIDTLKKLVEDNAEKR